MPKYFYTATSPEGETKTGTSEAHNEQELAKLLRKEGYILISANLEGSKKKINFFSKLSGVPIKEKLFFTRNFRLMIKAGVPLPKALNILTSQSKHKGFQKALLGIREEIVKGKGLSKALRGYPEIFSELFCSMIRVGEETGNLEEVLKNLTQQIEKTYTLRARVKGAMVYPIVIVVAMMGIGVLMLVMVVPKLAATFEELEIELPFTTRLIISSADLIIKFWFIFPVVLLVLIIFIKRNMRAEKRSKTVDKIILKLPIISPIVRETNTAQTSRTLGTLISSGVPIVKSLEVVSRTLGNFYFREAMSQAAIGVKKGIKLSDALKPYAELYPHSFAEMIAIGEETGETSDILEKLADFSEAEVENLTKNLTAAIEPVIMIIIGAAVGFFAVSMIQPMYSMLEAI